MSLQSNFTAFVASASTTVTPPNGPPQTYALPAVDLSNLGMVVSNNSNGTAWVMLGTVSAGMQPGPNTRGSMVIQSGQNLLLSNGTQGTATYAAVNLFVAGGSVTFQRGTATNTLAFTSHDDAVIV